MILTALGIKEKPHKIFSSLNAIEQDRIERDEKEGDGQKLVQSGFLNLLIKDTGWDIEVDL